MFPNQIQQFTTVEAALQGSNFAGQSINARLINLRRIACSDCRGCRLKCAPVTLEVRSIEQAGERRFEGVAVVMAIDIYGHTAFVRNRPPYSPEFFLLES